jgi:hypothetical protein
MVARDMLVTSQVSNMVARDMLGTWQVDLFFCSSVSFYFILL